jgi:hypothetical protein
MKKINTITLLNFEIHINKMFLYNLKMLDEEFLQVEFQNTLDSNLI